MQLHRKIIIGSIVVISGVIVIESINLYKATRNLKSQIESISNELDDIEFESLDRYKKILDQLG